MLFVSARDLLFDIPIHAPATAQIKELFEITESLTPFRSRFDLAESLTVTLLTRRFVKYQLDLATFTPYHAVPFAPCNVNLLKETLSAVIWIPYHAADGAITTPPLLCHLKVSDLLITRFSL